MKEIRRVCMIIVLCFFTSAIVYAQTMNDGKKISPDLFGLFFEDINYAADGGLYAELIQNRSFEYNPTEQKEWHPLSFWEYMSQGFSYGKISVETSSPIHSNNPHYIVLDVEYVGHEEKFKGESGVGIKNNGFNGIVLKAGEKYNLSLFVRQLSKDPITLSASLQSPSGKTIYAKNNFSTSSKEWKKYTASFFPAESSDSASLVILVTTKGKLAMDVISLFPKKTFKIVLTDCVPT